MAFNLDRTEAARRLGVSTRTIDRHIQSGRVRTRRVGKKTFLEEEDIEMLRSEDSSRREENYEVIINDEEKKSPKIVIKEEVALSPDLQMAITEFSRIYTDAQGIIIKKDEEIKDLSYKLGKTESELKNSVNASEYRQTASLLESIKQKNSDDIKNFWEKISLLEKEVQKRNSFIVGLVILFIFVITSTAILFLYNHFK